LGVKRTSQSGGDFVKRMREEKSAPLETTKRGSPFELLNRETRERSRSKKKGRVRLRKKGRETDQRRPFYTHEEISGQQGLLGEGMGAPGEEVRWSRREKSSGTSVVAAAKEKPHKERVLPFGRGTRGKTGTDERKTLPAEVKEPSWVRVAYARSREEEGRARGICSGLGRGHHDGEREGRGSDTQTAPGRDN